MWERKTRRCLSPIESVVTTAICRISHRMSFLASTPCRRCSVQRDSYTHVPKTQLCRMVQPAQRPLMVTVPEWFDPADSAPWTEPDSPLLTVVMVPDAESQL